MKLLVIVICLLSERFLVHAVSYQRFSWFQNYVRSILQMTVQNKTFTQPWVILASIVLPISLGVALIYFLLCGVLFGFIGFLLNLVIFFYCLGPQNVFYPSADKKAEMSQLQHIGLYFAQANTQLFAVTFWYILAGPIPALIYRLVTLAQTVTQCSEPARWATDVLEWIPARLTALLYLLVGNFQKGFSYLLKMLLAKPDQNQTLLSEAGILALRSDTQDDIPIPVAESLVEHAAVVLLVLVALLTLAAAM